MGSEAIKVFGRNVGFIETKYKKVLDFTFSFSKKVLVVFKLVALFLDSLIFVTFYKADLDENQ